MTIAVMHDKRELIQPLIIGDKAVGAVKRIVVGAAIELQRGPHRFAT